MALIKVCEPLVRPQNLDATAFSGAGVAQVLDALGLKTAMDYTIKPLAGQAGQRTGYLGPALTVKASPGDNLGLYAAIANAQPGDVLVISTTGYTGTGVMGDLMLMMARNRGIAAIVTDGLVRDSVGIQPVPVPVYCRGVSPNAPSRVGPATVGLPIAIGGITVNQGDMIFGDPDGIAAVPAAMADDLSEKLPKLLAAEKAFEEKLDSGLILLPEIAEFIQKNTTAVAL